ncbi:MAG: type II toxin-antitoxin system death-on-curing family toxin [Ponticaulis sp.]|nr:type II toxin-antitoxin system death-on-curing family toxin [Ponticaulis sp.]
MTEPNWVNRRALEILHDESIARDGGAAGLRDEGLLESALARPVNAFHYGTEDLCTLASLYADGIAQNHPFVDGNKRAAFLTCVIFLEINGLSFIAGEADAALKVFALAGGDIDEHIFADWLRNNVQTKD